MADTIRGVCPQCGKKLEIPAELEEFSCLYCGARMRTEALRAKPMEERAVEALLAQLPAASRAIRTCTCASAKRTFSRRSRSMSRTTRPCCRSWTPAAPGIPAGPRRWPGHAAAVMLDGLATHMEKDPRWGKRTRDNVFFDTKVALAIFFTPLLRKLQLELAEPLRTQLQTQWLARWPKQLWRPGDYDTLAGGFKKFRFCFITTATCAAEGKPDDCAELTAFRAFRDGWLRQRPDGPERIAEYYAVAPSIVAGVEYCDDAPARYAEIRARWLGPCYAALQRGEMERCYDTYRDMVQTLQERYGVQ